MIASRYLVDREGLGGCSCPECQTRSAADRVDYPAVARAEELLAQFLTPDQAKDWEANVAFTMRGSDGHLYRLSPTDEYCHDRLVRDDDWGTDVWPIRLGIAADWALAMMFYLGSDAESVMEAGCHDERQFINIEYEQSLS